MNLAALAVIIARERETGLGDHIDSVAGLGATRPILAWPMTIAMLSLAGIPATAGFIGKVYLIDAAVDGGYTWLGVFIVVASMISLASSSRVLAAMWMRPEASSELTPASAGIGGRPALAGGSPTHPPQPAAAAPPRQGPAPRVRGPPRPAPPAPPAAPAEASPPAEPEVVVVAVVFGVATLAGGIVP